MAQITIGGVLLIVPLVYTQALPAFNIEPPTPVFSSPPPPQPQVPVENVAPSTSQPRLAYRTLGPDIFRAPRDIAPPVQVVELPAGPFIPGGVPISSATPAITAPLSFPQPGIAPPPPPEPEPVVEASPAAPVRISGTLQSAKLIQKVDPIYPALAKPIRLSGRVTLSSVISRTGTIQQLEILDGHPILAKAAVDAVRQWIYSPTILSGQAVEVETSIEVNFVLR